MQVDARRLVSPKAVEIFVTAFTTPGTGTAEQLLEMFSKVRDIVASEGASILQERVFSTEALLPSVPAVRAAAYGDLDDGVAPAWLLTPPLISGDTVAVQVHAVKTSQEPVVLKSGEKPVGRAVEVGGLRYTAITGLTPSTNGSPDAGAHSLFADAECIVKGAGTELPCIARTWFWLGDILAWYDDFNRVRTEFFIEKGMIGGCEEEILPASTGIGIYPKGTKSCGLDFVTVTGEGSYVRRLVAAGNQDSAFKYGSAFSRASRVTTPAGETVFVSGTAAIDAEGRTVHIGDAAAQVACTIENVQGVLRDGDCIDDDVVTAIAYCKTHEVERVWREAAEKLPWPCITLIADVCRDDLLFEVEATAVRGASKLS